MRILVYFKWLKFKGRVIKDMKCYQWNNIPSEMRYISKLEHQPGMMMWNAQSGILLGIYLHFLLHRKENCPLWMHEYNF